MHEFGTTGGPELDLGQARPAHARRVRPRRAPPDAHRADAAPLAGARGPEPVAATHHERADGSGYHKGLRDRRRRPAARACSPRPTSTSGSPPTAPTARVRRRARGRASCAGSRPTACSTAAATDAVLAAAGHRRPARRGAPRPAPGGLTGREVEVLRLAARGLTTRAIAERALHLAEDRRPPHPARLREDRGVHPRRRGALGDAERDRRLSSRECGRTAGSRMGPRWSSRSASAPLPMACGSPTPCTAADRRSCRAATWLTHLDFDWESPVWRHWLSGLGDGHTARPLRRARLRALGPRGRRSVGRDLGRRSRDGGRRRRPRPLRAARRLAGRRRSRSSTRPAIPSGSPTSSSTAAIARGRQLRGPRSALQQEALISAIRAGWTDPNPTFRHVFSMLFLPARHAGADGVVRRAAAPLDVGRDRGAPLRRARRASTWSRWRRG